MQASAQKAQSDQRPEITALEQKAVDLGLNPGKVFSNRRAVSAFIEENRLQGINIIINPVGELLEVLSFYENKDLALAERDILRKQGCPECYYVAM